MAVDYNSISRVVWEPVGDGIEWAIVTYAPGGEIVWFKPTKELTDSWLTSEHPKEERDAWLVEQAMAYLEERLGSDVLFSVTRPRSAGSEVCLMHEGREFVLWRADWFLTDTPTPGDFCELVEWARPHVLARVQAEVDAAAEEVAEESTLDLADFLAWVRDHRDNPRVRECLKPLARYYLDEVM